MRACRGTTKDHRSCPNAAGDSGYCFTHDPARSRERADARARGGRRRHVGHVADAATLPGQVRSVRDVLAVLDYALEETVGLENSVQRNRALVTLSGAYLDAIKVGELEQRVEALEGSPNDVDSDQTTPTGAATGRSDSPERDRI